MGTNFTYLNVINTDNYVVALVLKKTAVLLGCVRVICHMITTNVTAD